MTGRPFAYRYATSGLPDIFRFKYASKELLVWRWVSPQSSCLGSADAAVAQEETSNAVAMSRMANLLVSFSGISNLRDGSGRPHDSV